ncbi:Allantoicase [Marasmius sp. AFHP31]|nr:Allantoicase [Marasmius sp. AFHP31]
MSYSVVPLEKFSEVFLDTTELSSCAIGGRVLSVSDEFFAAASHLLHVEPAPSLKGQFGPNGALYSGWESRRHNAAYDWCIVKLGTSGTIVGFDIDTSHFNGNEAPQVSVEAFYDPVSEDPDKDDARWAEILPKVNLGPSSRHLFTIPSGVRATFVKLNMYPDGGIARFRVYGHVAPIVPEDPMKNFDLAHVYAGGRVVFTSDQHFGGGANLILPGRGKDMGDGWETKRSRHPGHKDWTIIKLAVAGYLEQVEIDTAHFKGNFPESCEVHALYLDKEIEWNVGRGEDQDWKLILPRTKLGPHRQHFFQLENVAGAPYTHVRVTIYPDGGIKRVRVTGRRSQEKIARDVTTIEEGTAKAEDIPNVHAALSRETLKKGRVLPVLPLTPEAFAFFGQVIQAYGDHAAAPKGLKITPANGGTASKFHKLTLTQQSYPSDSGATTGLSVYRCQPLTDIASDGTAVLKELERHAFTNQAFIPMGKGSAEGLEETAEKYLVVVAKNGEDDKPDLKSLRAFVATTAQGVVYNTGIWHQPMTVLEKPLDFTCVETQIGNGSKADCEIVKVEEEIRLRIW